MSQHDFNVANQGFPAFRGDINNALAALASNSSGATAPSTTYAYQWWYDTTTNILKMRNADNDAWISFATFDQATDTWSVTSLKATTEVRTPAILDASGGTTATLNGIPLRPGVLDPENRIINGAFDFWQRGTSSTSNGYVAADRWINTISGGTVTMSRQAFTLGDTLGSNNPTYFLRHAVSGQSASSSYAILEQRIEGVRSYAGQTITILGWARRSSGSGNMAIQPVQNFGSGGSPSSEVTNISPASVTLTSSWAPFAAVVSIPSISGKTLGTNNDNYLRLFFWTSAGSDYNARTNSLGLQTIGVDLWGIHIKQGTHTTSAVDLYRQPELGPELARCQRYYQRFGPGTYIGIGMAWEANAARVVVNYAPKRGTPSFTSNEVVAYKAGSTGVIITSPSFDLPSSTSVLLYGSSSMATTAGQAIQVVTNGPSGFIAVDAEL